MRTTVELIRQHRFGQAYLRMAPVMVVVTTAALVAAVVLSLLARASFETSLQQSRSVTTSVFCASINDVEGKLRGLIVNGAKGSKVFEDVYRSHGAPPYKVRLRQARAQAATLAPLKCAAIADQVKERTDHYKAPRRPTPNSRSEP